MNCRNCRCSTAWWLEPAASVTPLKKPCNTVVCRTFENSIQAHSAGDGSFPLHVQASLTGVSDQIVDAIHAKGSLSRQQSIPVLSWKVRLQPEHAMHAGGTHLHETLVEASSDEIQRRC